MKELQGKIKLLRRVSLFSTLKAEELELLARRSEFRVYGPGQPIFTEDSPGEQLFVIREGEVLIRQRTRGQNELDLARFVAGEAFGELDLLDRAPRGASALAQRDTTLLVFPSQGLLFQDLAQEHPELFARILHKMLGIVAGRIRSTNRLISERTPWIEELRRQMLSDKLTGLYTRAFLEEDFAELLPQYGGHTSLIMLKPDNFKEINDTFGHEVGDGVLRLMAEAVRSRLRREDIPIRFRGDEFAAVLPSTGTETALEIAEELRRLMRRLDIQRITRGKSFDLTISIGISTYPIHARDHRTLTDSACERMFRARNMGGNRILCV